jgi:hypothetical protein
MTRALPVHTIASVLLLFTPELLGLWSSSLFFPLGFRHTALDMLTLSIQYVFGIALALPKFGSSDASRASVLFAPSMCDKT